MNRLRSTQHGLRSLLVSAVLGCSLWACGTENERLFGSTPMLMPQAMDTPPPRQAPPAEPPSPPAAAVPAMLPPPPPATPARPANPPPADEVEEEEPPPAEPAPCEEFGEFGAPELISGLGLIAPTMGPVFSADGLTLVFSAVDGDENIFSATRAPGSGVFTPAQPLPNLDAGGSDEGTPFLSFDGLSLYFFSTRPGPGVQGDRDIWVAQRPNLEAPFAEPVVLPGVNGPDLEHLPRLSRDELSIAFVSARDSSSGAGASNLWIAQRADRAGEFSAAVEVPGINTGSREEGFSFSADGLTLFFATNRVDLAHMDLFVATRAAADATFETPQPLTALNSDTQELDPQLSPDGLELFFASDRQGTFELFRAVRECLDP